MVKQIKAKIKNTNNTQIENTDKTQVKNTGKSEVRPEITCECGAKSYFVKPDNGSYTPNEGWYALLKGDITVHGKHDVAFFVCKKCGKEWWIFT